MWGFNVVDFETPSVHVNTYMCVCLCSLPPPPPDLGSITLFAAITIILGCLKIGYFVGFSECLSATEGVFPVTHAVHTLLQVNPTVIVHVALASVECIPGWMWNGMRWGGSMKWACLLLWGSVFQLLHCKMGLSVPLAVFVGILWGRTGNRESGNCAKLESTSKVLWGGYEYILLSFIEL